MTQETVSYKKYIYALRPLLAYRYIENRHSVPPVLFEELIKEQLPDCMKKAVEEMLVIKVESAEKEFRPQIPEIRDFIKAEIERISDMIKEKEDNRNTDWEPLNKIFLEIVNK